MAECISWECRLDSTPGYSLFEQAHGVDLIDTQLNTLLGEPFDLGRSHPDVSGHAHSSGAYSISILQRVGGLEGTIDVLGSAAMSLWNLAKRDNSVQKTRTRCC